MGEIETEAELIQQTRLPAHIKRAPMGEAVLADRIEQDLARLEHRAMRFALRQHRGCDAR